MNKYKKIAVAVVSTVMAASMVFSLAACGNNDDNSIPPEELGAINQPGKLGGTADSDAVSGAKPTATASADNGQALLHPSNSNNKLTFASGTTLDLAIGYDSAKAGITYNDENVTTVDGHKLAGTVNNGQLKPAWKGFQATTGIQIHDVYAGQKAGDHIGYWQQQTGGLDNVTVFTASASTINNTAKDNKQAFLDMSKYLDYMPNYKRFLEQSDVITASLIGDPASGAQYMIPYFDGNDDIEKFVLLRKDLVETLLDGATGETMSTTTFRAQADAKNNTDPAPAAGAKSIIGYKASATSWMGRTGNWTVDVTDPSVLTGTPAVGTNKAEATANTTTTIKIDYDKALADAKSTEAGTMGAILKTVQGVTDEYIAGQVSGNIVDIMNLAINASIGEVTGGQLVQLLRRYIDVAYTKADGTQFYASANGGLKRSDVFNSACAAWDADLYTALGRVFVTCGSMLGSEAKDMSLTYLLAGRQYTTQRTTDVCSLAGELYGARGLESRYNYSYITADGELVDARGKNGFWEALLRINNLTKEGLFNTANNVINNNASHSGAGNKGIQTLSEHDYVQTQTSAMGFTEGSKYNFAPVLTPVSIWNADGDTATQATGREDGRETIMRFTESWRSVKDGGLVISYGNVKDNPDKLAAALAFIDYMYSPDGQKMFTYGTRDTTNNSATPDGTWWATEVTNKTLEEVADAIPGTDGLQYVSTQYEVKDAYKAQYFVYDGKIYSGTYYNGRNIPTMTDENLDVFATKEGHNFTNHARQLLGTTLPAGNKDQGFEYQCTAPCGIVGSQIVNIALNNNTIKHPVQTIKPDDTARLAKTPYATTAWYDLVPTQLPYDTTTNGVLGQGNMGQLTQLSSTGIYQNSSNTSDSILLDMMYYGLDTSRKISGYGTSAPSIPGTVAGVIAQNNTMGLSRLNGFKRQAWVDTLARLGIVL